MAHFTINPAIPARILASDLDGTLIPLPNHPNHPEALMELGTLLRQSSRTLIFATGRHYESVLEALDQYRLPTPEWIVCDVGSSIYRKCGDAYECFRDYEDYLRLLCRGQTRRQVEVILAQAIPDLALQPAETQREFKISYQCPTGQLKAFSKKVESAIRESNLNFSAISSVDPFQDLGFIDVLPCDVSKSYALLWLSTHADFSPDEVVYAGDSGNDLAALTCGFRAIVVSNAAPDLVDEIRDKMTALNLQDRLYLAQGAATQGVLDGCRHFGLVT